MNNPHPPTHLIETSSVKTFNMSKSTSIMIIEIVLWRWEFIRECDLIQMQYLSNDTLKVRNLMLLDNPSPLLI